MTTRGAKQPDLEMVKRDALMNPEALELKRAHVHAVRQREQAKRTQPAAGREQARVQELRQNLRGGARHAD